MSEQDRIRVGDRITIATRGKKKIYVADFWHNNVHRKVSLKTTNKKVATERATKLASELLDGNFRPSCPSIDITDASERYLEALETEDRAKTTLTKYKGIFNNFIEFLRQRRVTKLQQFFPMHFDAWRSERRKIRESKTVYTESVVIKQLFKWAKDRGLLAEDPIQGIKLGKKSSERRQAPTFQEVCMILEAEKSPLKLLFMVLAFTGMRIGELRNLLVEDIDWKGNWIHVKSRKNAKTKSGHSRKVPIHPRLKQFLELLPRRSCGPNFTAKPSVDYPKGDHALSPKRVNNQFKTLLRKLGLPAGRKGGYTLHSFRHFFETITVNAGIPQRVIDTWLGHRSDKSMAAIYYNLADADSQSFILKVTFDPPTELDLETRTSEKQG